MNRPWETENCDEIVGYAALYQVHVAAALWCGIPKDQIGKYINESVVVTRGIYRHPKVKCLEAKCVAMHQAIDSGELLVSRENGKIVTDHVAPERRYVSRDNLKKWIAKAFPGKKPEFLFDEIERTTHASINADSFRALQADLGASKSENERLRELIRKLTEERDSLRGENQSLKAMVDKKAMPDPRSEATFLNIIGSLLKLMLMTSPAGKPHSIFESQAAIISALLAYHPNVPGISDRTLEQKFADANRSLAAV